MRIAIGIALVSGLALAAPAPLRELVTDCPEASGTPICKVRNGWSFKFDSMNNRTPLVYGIDGHFRFPLLLQIPNVDVTYAQDIAPDSDGSLVVAAIGGAADMRHWQKSGLVFFDANGTRLRFVDTGAFLIAHVVVAQDHSIWAAGTEYKGMKENQHYAVLRKYSQSGELQGSFLDRSTFAGLMAPGGPSPSQSLFSNGDRIALMVYSGENGSQRELIELDLNGNQLARMRFDYGSSLNYGFTSSGAFFAGRLGPSATILQLDPETGATKEVKAPAGQWMLFGSDGQNLLYRSVTPDRHLKVGWFAPHGD